MSATITIPEPDPLLPARDVAGFYRIHIGSLRRWCAQGIFPKPDVVIAKRNYCRQSTIDRVNRERTVEHAAAQLEDHERLTTSGRRDRAAAVAAAVKLIIAEALESGDLQQRIEQVLRDEFHGIEREVAADRGDAS